MPTKLDGYKAIIETRLAVFPALSAVRLLAEIRAGGYKGSYTQLTAFVRQVWPTPSPAPVIRFETPAGRQAQVDYLGPRRPARRSAAAREGGKPEAGNRKPAQRPVPRTIPIERSMGL